MAAQFSPGDAVQTPFGKGVVREVRNNHRLLVDVHDRALVLKDSEISALDGGQRAVRRDDAGMTAADAGASRRDVPGEIDLHGLTVAEALASAESAVNDALLADRAELRLIHGRSGGRIRAALHQRLREIASVRGFHADPANDGVTIVRF
jgi:dsDNA-specific endonuclease/ATPase MutS2